MALLLQSQMTVPPVVILVVAEEERQRMKETANGRNEVIMVLFWID